MYGTSRKTLEMLRRLCGNDTLVVLGTTKWDDVSLEIGQRREKQLQDKYWKEMIQYGSTVMQVDADSSSSAWDIMNRILLTVGGVLSARGV